ncbi:MAG: T9SS type A sorting domain-containing protein [Bacteroidia bacterium]
MPTKTLFLLVTLQILTLFCKAQPYFSWHDSIPVSINNIELNKAWAGGLNFVQASNIHLNDDDTIDLFVFDRSGNKVRTFVNSNNVYEYAPQYENAFPILQNWALLIDYNCDNKADIFTSSEGGIAIYKNTSDPINGLQFQLVTTALQTNYTPPSGANSILYVLPIDVPSIADIDNDGDLDILTFTSNNGYIHYHQNQSMELYNHCDSLIFEIKNRCWGYASENALSNVFTLYDTCSGNVTNPGIASNNNSTNKSNLHQGGCSLCIDIDNDSDKDFIVGDVSSSNLTLLTNGGTLSGASFTAQDATFPQNNGGSIAAYMPSFPCAFSVDLNGDDKKDLLVSSNAPNISENHNSLAYYENVGTNSFPAYQFQQNNFLQDHMIDVGEGAYPAFFDLDNDGLKDLFVGNYGYYNNTGFASKIALFKNTGTMSAPAFTLITRDFMNLSSLNILNLVPSFGDMDADGDADMLLGGQDGKLHYYQNTANTGDSATFILLQSNLTNTNNRVIDIGDYATPQIVDVDGDNKNDIVIGARNGKLAYYHTAGNNGNSIPLMDSVSHYWGNVLVNRPGYFIGYSYPFLFKQNGITKLLVGAESGYLNLYENIDNNINGNFILVDSTYQQVFQGTRTAPYGTDLNNDGLLDLIIGNYQGGLSYYKGTVTNPNFIDEYNHSSIRFDFTVFPNPTNDELKLNITNSTTTKFQIILYSTLGKKEIETTINSSNYMLNTQKLENGVYFLEIGNTDDTKNKEIKKTKRIIVLR